MEETIIEDGLNKRIFGQDDKCKKCKTVGFVRRNFEGQTMTCRKCGYETTLTKQYMKEKPKEEKKK